MEEVAPICQVMIKCYIVLPTKQLNTVYAYIIISHIEHSEYKNLVNMHPNKNCISHVLTNNFHKYASPK